MKKGRVNAKYDEEYIKANRTFPVWKSVLLVVILIGQITMITAACLYKPKPQDVIHEYEVTVHTLPDGTLDIEYHLVWEALDPDEDLTWIEIGMANESYSVYPHSVSGPIDEYYQKDDDGWVYLKLYLDRPYKAGEVLELSFTVNQRDMLCKDGSGYFYEFVPCWFNATQVKRYAFRWMEHTPIQSAENARYQDDGYIWTGSLDYGEYVPMKVRYGADAFNDCAITHYQEFDDSGAYNSLQEDKGGVIALAVFAAAFLIIIQVCLIDSVVSYYRGRGFMSGYGYHVHVYGRSNPYYHREAEKHAAKSGRSGGGRGGCACACACACAGGGRAGCSQKDTFEHE